MIANYILKNLTNYSTEQKSKQIIQLIDKKVNSRYFKKFTEVFYNNTLLDKEEIIFFIKKKILDNFNYTTNAFNKKIHLSNVRSGLLAFVLMLLVKLFIKKKVNIEKKIYLLLDLIGSNHELSFYKKIIDKYGKQRVLVFKDQDFNLTFQDVKFIKPNKLLHSIIPIKHILNYLSHIVLVYRLSKKLKLNLFYFLNRLILENYFFNYVFNKTNIKTSLIHKHYSTNNIKHYYLRKLKIKSYAIQKNINTTISNGYYYDVDCLFSLSRNCKIENFNTYSKIKEHKIVGSFFMQRLFKKIETSKQNLSYDILYLAGNGLKPGLYYDSYKEYSRDYLLQLEWLKQISLDFPNLKVGFKHHSNNNDSFEEKILKSSNVLIVDKKINSYHLVSKSKFICSWASTMVVEAISMSKFAFFLNPGLRNSQFLSRIKNYETISIINYKDFLKKFKYAKSKSFIRNKSNNSFCVFNKNISNDIFKVLNNENNQTK